MLEYSEVLKKKARVVKGIMIIGIILIPITAIVIIAINASNSQTKVASFFLLFGSIFTSIIITFLVEIKSILGKFARNYISFCTGCCWIFLVLPFCVLIPFSLVYNSSSSETLGNIV